MNIPAQQEKAPRDSLVTLSVLMMPEHANHFGNVHGGVLMKLADETAAIAAMRHAQKPAVTVAMDSMNFKQPVNVGDLVICTARVSYVHRSSMEVSVEISAENPITGVRTHTNSAYLVFVGLGSDGRPVKVPQLKLLTPEDQLQFENGARRQAMRLERENLGKPSP